MKVAPVKAHIVTSHSVDSEQMVTTDGKTKTLTSLPARLVSVQLSYESLSARRR